MKKTGLSILLLIFPMLLLWGQSTAPLSAGVENWDPELLREFRRQTESENISERTMRLLTENLDTEYLSGTSEDIAHFLFEQACNMDKQLRRGVPLFRIELQFKNSLEVQKAGRYSEMPGRNGRDSSLLAPGHSGKVDSIFDSGKPEVPGKSGDAGASGQVDTPGNGSGGSGSSGQGNDP